MWECPDVFSLDGKTVLLTSPQDTRADQLEGLSGNCGIAVVGTVDPETGKLREEWIQPMDYGIDFYAHQSVKTTDGRRVMIGWMQNWDACGERNPKQNRGSSRSAMAGSSRCLSGSLPLSESIR